MFAKAKFIFASGVSIIYALLEGLMYLFRAPQT